MSDQEPLFFNRELSWLEFNQRVLGEALDTGVPLLERVKFLAITSSNLDEFYMVRVGGLNIMVSNDKHTPDITERTPAKQLEELSQRTHEMIKQQYQCFNEMLEPGLEEIGIRRYSQLDLNETQYKVLSDRFDREIYPIISPLGIHPDGSMPLIGNQVIHLAVKIKEDNAEHPHRIIILPLDSPVPRFFTLQSNDRHAYILSEDVVSLFCDRYFPNQEVLECVPFRITRNADMRVEEEFSADLMEDMSALLESRKDSDCVRLEAAANCSEEFLTELQTLFDVPPGYTYVCDGPLDLKAWFQIAGLRGFEEHQAKSWSPTNSPRIDLSENIFDEISKNDVILHHPFESFNPVVRLVETAADDPDVLAIKQTLYRTSSNSSVVAALVRAAENGKSVTVIIELKARFDEARNIVGAKALQQAGAHVIYGVKGLKTHAKSLIIIRREPQGIRRYMHFGTGNYNESTAKLYTDISLLTSDPILGNDATSFFNAVTGFTQPSSLQKLAMAPLTLRNRILELIRFETERAKADKEASITAKMNSLVDPTLIKELYQASQAGVTINLNIRGICCLRPGIPGLSENIRVVSIIDRFLEHSRLMHFNHGGENIALISSADWMPRNLDRRVELLIPIESTSCKKVIIHALRTFISENVKGHVLQADGTYQRVPTKNEDDEIRSQEVLYQQAVKAEQLAKQSAPTTFEPHKA